MSGNMIHVLEKLEKARDPSEIVRLAEEALCEVSREDNPLAWASLQGSLGAALVAEARGRYTDELFARVLQAYESALTVYSPEETPEIWAQTMRNIGATHLGALQSRIGDPRTHIEAAIAAYERALELPFEKFSPEIWLRCQQEFARAWEIAASWRGPEALVRAARAYKAALRVADRKADPQIRALLKLQIADCLNETGAEEFAEEAIAACEGALEVLRREQTPREWAQAHLIRGGLYRTRRPGDREENLERAISSLDQALSVFTKDTAPEQWYRAHYSRGPAYLFRVRGERAENLELALESLRIAVAGTPRARAPDAWAALLVTLAQVYLERSAGERSENIEKAIAALESALAVLQPDPHSRPWILAGRYLGQAYLERRLGDPGENIEKARAALAAVQEALPRPDDPAAWCAAQANLAEVYRRRRRGEPQSNRAQAIACFEAALAMPPQAWGDPSSWFTAQAWRASLYLDENAETIGRPEPTGRDIPVPRQEEPTDRRNDPFAGRAQAGEALEVLRSDQQPLATDPEWHVPFLLNEEIAKLRHHFQEFLGSGAVLARTPAERSVLERSRWQLFCMALEHLQEKYAAARRTRKVLAAIAEQRQGFVLFLRGFAYRARYYEKATVNFGSGDNLRETTEKRRLVAKVSPTPVIWIANPMESGALELATAEADEERLGYRIEAGESWETDVHTLISLASAIVVHNPTPTPGVANEIRLVTELGRLEDTYFFYPEQAREVLSDGTANPLTDAVLERLRAAPPRSGVTRDDLPAPTCRWLQDARRARVAAEAAALRRWLEGLANQRAVPAIDLKLDACAFLLAHGILLEDIGELPHLLDELAQTLQSLPAGQLPEASGLARRYSRLAAELRSAWDRAPADLTELERTAEALRPEHFK